MPDLTPKVRDATADYRKSIEDAIALRESLGLQATPHLLAQLGELDAKGSLDRLADETPGVSVELERKDVEPPAERAVPAKAARPKKPSDADSPAGS